jgi:hypothetical protein
VVKEHGEVVEIEHVGSAHTLEHLVTFEPMVSMVGNAHHVYLASGAERGAEATEVNEGTFERGALANVPELIAKGRIVNSVRSSGCCMCWRSAGRVHVRQALTSAAIRRR